MTTAGLMMAGEPIMKLTRQVNVILVQVGNAWCWILQPVTVTVTHM